MREYTYVKGGVILYCQIVIGGNETFKVTETESGYNIKSMDITNSFEDHCNLGELNETIERLRKRHSNGKICRKK